ncbi:hypothetical protein OS493_033384 [Desmophyllum pertusum]|uniref:VWFA domain-containing protein n=1 Tax=Desmophyllum pertusum TaxID=174260 RepID=A0A9W9YJ18_9CNID|nr:hypothetical protein OS493_033384 [Desmophyllum pertusum]
MGTIGVLLPIALFLLANFQFVIAQDWLKTSKEELLKLRNDVNSYESKKSDIVFLVDTSGSLWTGDFDEEKKFVMNLLNEISVGNQATRVEVIPFGETASKFIDQISAPTLPTNKCTFNKKFKPMDQSINGWKTNMKDAFELAWEVCLNNGLKRSGQIKTVVMLLTDGYWNLRSLVSDPDKYAFKLKDFTEFGELATYIRGDPYEAVWQVDGVDPSECNNNCDVKAQCACGLVYGDYKCGCFKGYAGSGLVGQCHGK